MKKIFFLLIVTLFLSSGVNAQTADSISASGKNEISIDEIKKISTGNSKKTEKSILIGVLIGAGFGAFMGGVVITGHEGKHSLQSAILCAVIGGVIGGIVGGIAANE